MRLVDDEGVVGLEAAVARDLGYEDPVRHDLDVRLRADLVVEPDLAPDHTADPSAELAGDARGDAPGRDSARLGVADPAGRPPPRGEADLGELGRLSGPGLTAHHHHRMSLDGRCDRVAFRGDGQLGGKLRHREPGTSRRPGSPGAIDGRLEPTPVPPVGAPKSSQPRAQAGPIADHGFLDRKIETGSLDGGRSRLSSCSAPAGRGRAPRDEPGNGRSELTRAGCGFRRRTGHLGSACSRRGTPFGLPRARTAAARSPTPCGNRRRTAGAGTSRTGTRSSCRARDRDRRVNAGR